MRATDHAHLLSLPARLPCCFFFNRRLPNVCGRRRDCFLRAQGVENLPLPCPPVPRLHRTPKSTGRSDDEREERRVRICGAPFRARAHTHTPAFHTSRACVPAVASLSASRRPSNGPLEQHVTHADASLRSHLGADEAAGLARKVRQAPPVRGLAPRGRVLVGRARRVEPSQRGVRHDGASSSPRRGGGARCSGRAARGSCRAVPRGCYPRPWGSGAAWVAGWRREGASGVASGACRCERVGCRRRAENIEFS